MEGSGEAARAVGVRLADGRVFRRVAARIAAAAGCRGGARLRCLRSAPAPHASPRLARLPCRGRAVASVASAPPAAACHPLFSAAQGQDGGQQRHAVGHV